ncbi:MAG: SDR family NAD(P)-dependent oxidoreductase, partial [Anaerolineae bacterium]|nr:SDR family NAD(P)-dependent oxidoreductase [Anaerolineae bacterium]
MNFDRPFDLTGKGAVITGGGGVLCSVLARALAQHGASVAVLDINLPAAERVADEIRTQGGQAIAIQADVLDKESLSVAAQRVTEAFGHMDILINGAGGNKEEATTSDERSFFDLPADAI